MEVSRNRIVLIEWIDSRGCTSDWEFLEDVEPQKPCNCITVGFILEDHSEYLTVVQTVSVELDQKNSQIMARMTIPRCAISAVRELS